MTNTKMTRAEIGVPKKFVGITVDDYKPTSSAQRTVKEKVVAYTGDFKAQLESGHGLCFIGPPGLGKTYLASAIALMAVDAGYRAKFITLAQYVKLYVEMFTLESAWNKMADDDAYDDWRRIKQALKELRTGYDFLVIDDIGKEHTTNSRFAEDEFDYLIRRRAHHGLPSILTSNHGPRDWTAKYSASMSSFLFEICEVLGLDGNDYRKSVLYESAHR